MKYLVISVLLCALPAMAAAQMVTCTTCTHEVSVYMGEGGFVAEAPAETEMVAWVSRCGDVTMSGHLAPNADNLVAMVFSDANGLACNAEGAQLEVGPVMDGGWFWITDDTNSAVGPLVNQGILDSATIDITSAGAGVTMMAGKGAVFMKELATGRVGILGNILPEEPTPGLPPCGYRRISAGNDAANFARVRSSCALGDGGVMARVAGPALAGVRILTLVELGGTYTVTRPRTGTAIVDVEFYGNGTGHYTNPDVSDVDPRAGHLGSGVALSGGILSLADPPGAASGLDVALPNNQTATGVAQSQPVTTFSRYTISPSTTYCGTATAPLHQSLPVSLRFNPLNLSAPEVVPPVAVASDGRVARSITLNVVCPP